MTAVDPVDGGQLPTVRLSVEGNGRTVVRSRGLREAWRDGTIAVAAGTLGVGTGLPLVGGSGWRWGVLWLLGGVAAFCWGAYQRRRTLRPVTVAVVVAAEEPRRGLEDAAARVQQAVDRATESATLTLKAVTVLPPSTDRYTNITKELVRTTQVAMRLAARLAPDSRIELRPVMPLHVGFWFGAYLGVNHVHKVAVLQESADGAVAATFLRDASPAATSRPDPLVEIRPMVLADGDENRVALAIDLQNRGEDFDARVRDACATHGIGRLVLLRSQKPALNVDDATFNAVVDQIVRVWRGSPLPDPVRSGQRRRFVFLSGPVAIAIGIGARLAGQDRHWTALTYDRDNGKYEPLPPPAADPVG